MTPTPIIIDCDPGHDDAIALLLAIASPEVELIGVTTVAGNTTLDKTTNNALRILELGGRSDIPVYRGADRPFIRPQDIADHVAPRHQRRGRYLFVAAFNEEGEEAFPHLIAVHE